MWVFSSLSLEFGKASRWLVACLSRELFSEAYCCTCCDSYEEIYSERTRIRMIEGIERSPCILFLQFIMSYYTHIVTLYVNWTMPIRHYCFLVTSLMKLSLKKRKQATWWRVTKTTSWPLGVKRGILDWSERRILRLLQQCILYHRRRVNFNFSYLLNRKIFA